MKNMFRNVILLAAVVAMVAPALVFAADEPTAPPPPPPARERNAGTAPAMGGGQGMRGMGGFGSSIVWQLVQRLELDEAQKAKVKDLQTASTEKTQDIRQSLMAANMKLAELPLTDASEADIRATATEVGKLMGDQAVLQAAALKDVKALLTDEQKAKLDEMIKENQAQMAARRNEMRNQTQEGRREVRTREGREGRPTPPPAPAPQN